MLTAISMSAIATNGVVPGTYVSPNISCYVTINETHPLVFCYCNVGQSFLYYRRLLKPRTDYFDLGTLFFFYLIIIIFFASLRYYSDVVSLFLL